MVKVDYSGLEKALNERLSRQTLAERFTAKERYVDSMSSLAATLAMEFARNHPDFERLYGTFMTEQLDHFVSAIKED